MQDICHHHKLTSINTGALSHGRLAAVFSRRNAAAMQEVAAVGSLASCNLGIFELRYFQIQSSGVDEFKLALLRTPGYKIE